MYAAMRATVPGVKIYWHKKGMFIQGKDESEDVSVICDDNLIEHLAYWRDKKKLLIKTSRLGYWQAWCPRWSCHPPHHHHKLHGGVIIPTWWQAELWQLAASHVIIVCAQHCFDQSIYISSLCQLSEEERDRLILFKNMLFGHLSFNLISIMLLWKINSRYECNKRPVQWCILSGSKTGCIFFKLLYSS